MINGEEIKIIDGIKNALNEDGEFVEEGNEEYLSWVGSNTEFTPKYDPQLKKKQRPLF